MDIATSKRLAEFIRVCWHEHKDKPTAFSRECTICGKTFYGDGVPDFTTPDGWQLIADEITKRGKWCSFRHWLMRNYAQVDWSDRAFDYWMSLENKPAKKSAIVAEWRKEVER